MKTVSCVLFVAAVFIGAGKLTAQITFLDVSSTAGISGVYSTTSVTFNDFDDDQIPDIFITHESGTKLYRNNNNGTFTSYLNFTGLSPTVWSSQMADIDNDGDLDIVVAGEYGSPTLKIYRNDGGLIFTDITTSSIGLLTDRIFSTALFDYDNDGFVDLFLAALGGGNIKLYKNNGNNTFSDVTNEAGLSSYTANARGLASGDYDNDGWIDLFIPSSNYNCIFLKNKNGFFLNVTAATGLSSVYGSIHNALFADYDDDGDLDLLIGMSNYPFRLFQNNNGVFTEVTNSCGIYLGTGEPRGAQFADFDNDGDLDLIMQAHITNKRIAVFRNNGNGTFTDVTDTANLIHTAGETSHVMACADYDHDGKIDFIDGEHSRVSYLYRNTTVSGAHWLKLRLSGVLSNQSAIGAHLMLKTAAGWQNRRIAAGNGYNGQNDLTRHFGLGSATTIDSLIVQWPSGITIYYTNVSTIDTTLVLYEIDLSDPKPVANIIPHSDYTTPTSITLTWTDPTEFYNQNPLDTFVVDIYREGTLLASVPKGVETYTENGLVDGRYCIYSFVTRHIPTDSTSNVVTSEGWYAGGHPVPAAPTNLVAVGYVNLARLTWSNPTTQIDGTPLDDLAKIYIYRNNSLIDSVDQNVITDTVYYDHIPSLEMNYVYKVRAVDNETPANLSEFSNESIAPAAMTLSDTALTYILDYGATDSSSFWIHNRGLSDLVFDIKERRSVFTYLKESRQNEEDGLQERNDEINSAGNFLSADRAPLSVRRSSVTARAKEAILLSAGDYNAFGSDAWGEYFVKFDLTAPQYPYTIGNQSGLFIDGASFSKDGSVLYAIERYGTPRFGRIDTATGVFTQIAALPSGSWTDMTVDPTDGTIYAAYIDGSSNSFLYSISATGAPTLKGAVTGVNILIGLAADRNGNLYGYDIGGDNFYSINKANGSAALIGPIGFDASYAQSLEFDLNENICYMAAFNVSNFEAELRTVNLGTGATTLIGKIGTGYNVEICGLGIASTGLPWVDVRPSSGVVESGDSAKVTVIWKGVVSEKTIIPYDGYLSILSNDPLMPAQNIRLHLDVTIDVNDISGVPAHYELHNNYPNPFNPTTTIRYDLKDAGMVTLKIYNILGQEVRTLVNRNETAGFKSVAWDGKDNAGRMVSSGLYIYRIEAGKFVKNRKMMILK